MNKLSFYKPTNEVIPEELLTNEIKKTYKTWMYKKIPVRVLVDQYLQILDLNQPLFL